MTRDHGVKHVCYKCATKFYDLNKPAPICPKCGADQREGPAKPEPGAAERKRTKAKRAEEDAPAAVQVADDDDQVVNEAEEESEEDEEAEVAEVEDEDD